LKIPFFDWASLYKDREKEFNEIIARTLGAGSFILQRDVAEFEERLAKYVGAKYAVGLSDGTNAILLGLRASNLQPGDDILITSHCFIAAPQSIHHAGFNPIPVELSTDDWLLDTDLLENYLTDRTKAIMPVHVNGRV
jgi:dTDP-4-amino-4,6-dideoxygalactose transaminase